MPYHRYVSIPATTYLIGFDLWAGAFRDPGYLYFQYDSYVIAAACFLLFLENNNLLQTANDSLIISNEALAALTLYVASSKPEEMETVKRLIISVLNRNQL